MVFSVLAGARRRPVLLSLISSFLIVGSLLLQSTPAAGVTCTVNGLVNPSSSDVQDLLDGTVATVTFSGYCYLSGLDIDRDVKIVGAAGSTIDADFADDYIFNIVDNAQVTMTGLTLIEAANSAVWVDPGVLHVSRTTFRNNIDPDECDEGGALWVGTGSDLFVTSSTFTGNSACEGGAIYGEYPDQIEVASSTFTNNSAWTGGAISIVGCAYDTTSCLTLSKSSFTANVASYLGGAVSLMGAAANVSMSNFTRNVGYSAGGAIVTVGWYAYYMDGDGTPSVAGLGTPGGVSIALDGYYGGPDLGGTLTVSGSNFTSNIVSDYSGGMLSGGGGAIATYLTDELRLSSSKFVGNTTTIAGGAVVTFVTDVEVTGTTFSRNTVISGGEGAGGGALALYNGGAPWPSTANITSSTFSSNSSYSEGGAIWSDYPFVQTARSRFVSNSTMYGPGGALYGEVYEYQDTASTFEANKALDDNDGDGGAMFVVDGEVLFDRTVVRKNLANNYGGGVFGAAAELVFEGATVSGNRTQESGGGVYVEAYSGDVSIETDGDTVFSQNSAFYSGGAIGMVDGDTYLMSAVLSGTFTGNRSVHHGGAISVISYVGGGNTLAISDAKIERNTTGDEGGGVYVFGCYFCAEGDVDVTITDEDGPVSISYNKATGSIGNGAGLWLEVDDFDILTPVWDGGSPTATATVKVLYNRGKGDGAGIYADLGSYSYLGDGTWVRYNADGGIYDYDCDIDWDGASITSNTPYDYYGACD